MDRRTLAAVVLALTTYWVWTVWVTTTQPLPPEVELVGDEVGGEALTAEPTATEPVEEPAGEPTISAAATPPPAPELPEREISFDACLTHAVFSTRGGVMRELTFLDHQAPFQMQPIWTWVIGRISGSIDGPWSPYGEEPGLEDLVSPKGLVFAMGTGSLDSSSPSVEVVEEGKGLLVLRGRTSDGIEVTRSFVENDSGAHCVVDVTTTWRNANATSFDGGLWLGLHDVIPPKPASYGNSVFPYAMVDGGYEYVSNMEKLDGPREVEGPVDWMSLADRYFALVLIPQGDPRGTLYWSGVREGDQTAWGQHYVIARTLAPGESYSEAFTLYAGPKVFSVFKELHPGLGKLVNLGWFAFFARILLFSLRVVHGVVGQWGVAIIGLTLLVKALFFPLTHASFKSSQAMQELQPQLQRIREKFKDQPEELNRQTMELFKQSGVNPLGGCLPMLIQMPVWIALYAVLLNSVELYHTEFLYLRDLSSVDPYGALPAVVVVLMVVQQQFMPTGNMDPAQARMMKLMPLIFGFFFFTFPSGLVLYIFVNMVLTIIQQWYIRRTFKDASAAVAATTS